MRRFAAILVLVISVVVIALLDRPLGPLPALGRLLDPMNGCWASAERTGKKFDLDLALDGLRAPVSVRFDERLVPHIYAKNDHDLYYVQGYIHAYFRLWQMDLQTRAAAGRVSEVLGKKALEFDRLQRRKGMVYGAENSLKAMEAEGRSRTMLNAYTEGVNNYINKLSYRKYPVEYKLMSFEPEQWTNLKTALLLKYMADDLTGYTEDIALTLLRDRLGGVEDELFKKLYPETNEGSTPVIVAGTSFDAPSLTAPVIPPDSLTTAHLDSTDFAKDDETDGKGSNNWVLSGKRTQSGAAILCNDPHLGLNLPSLWFEVQWHAPGINVYGASLPGAPGVVIGFNDNLSWGFTNNYRDVKDFYAIRQDGPEKYWFNGQAMSFTNRIERIGVKGGSEYIDTVHYTIHGPVIYDEHFHGPGGLKKPLAMSWMAHRSSNELLSLYLLNRAMSYPDFVVAIQHFKCPAQNMAYADRDGNIALWGQGQFINKWKGQGRYVMNGTDSATLWKELIPMSENPHVLNPEQGFVSSANQTVTDSTYPYWYNGYFYEFRAWRINEVLSKTQNATVKDMFALQNDTYSILAANVLPVMLRYLDFGKLNEEQRKQAEALRTWNYQLSAESTSASLFQVWWQLFYEGLWKQTIVESPDVLYPSPERTMALIKTDSSFNIAAAVNSGYKKAMDSLAKFTNKEWYHVKNTSVKHLTKIPSFSFTDLKMGGWGNTVNAAKGNHGPSWRMVVQMGKQIEAYGVYPGGQSGNPGSKYYASFLNHWVEGNYYKLSFVPDGSKPQKMKYNWNIQPR
jgi:penicillin amidase